MWKFLVQGTPTVAKTEYTATWFQYTLSSYFLNIEVNYFYSLHYFKFDYMKQKTEQRKR